MLTDTSKDLVSCRSTVRHRPPLITEVVASCKKEVKRGFRSFPEPMICGLSFERLPAWLWVLRSVEWSTILISEHDNDRLQQNYPEIVERFGSKLQVFERGDGNAIMASVWWISGSLSFANAINVPMGTPQVMWIPMAPRRVPRDLRPGLQWLSVSHAKVGGTTTSRAVFCLENLDNVQVPSDLTRNVGHIIKFSIRSTPCPPSLEEPHYSLNSKLTIGRLDIPVVVPSDFSATGWGRRMLDPRELAAAFELPDYLPWNDRFVKSLVPLQLFRVIMDEVLTGLTPTENVRSKRRLAGPADTTNKDADWLPTLKRWLPGCWCHVPIASKAVKDDNAPVNTYPWHQRILLVIPGNPQALATITTFMMRRWRRNIIRSFFSYLEGRYGTSWSQTLSGSLKRQRRSPEAIGGIEGGVRVFQTPDQFGRGRPRVGRRVKGRRKRRRGQMGRGTIPRN